MTKWDQLGIDWEKVKNKPDKLEKVPGGFLLDVRDVMELRAKKIKKLEEDNQGQESQIEKLTTDVDRLQGQLDVATRELSELKGLFERTVKEKDALLKEIADGKESMRSQLEARVKKLEDDVRDKDEAATRMGQEIMQLKDAVAARDTRIAEMKLAVEKAKKVQQEAEAENQYLRDEIAAKDFAFFKKIIKDRATRAAGDAGNIGLDQ